MHLPDGMLSLPVTAATLAVGGAGFAYGLRRLRGLRGDRTTVLMGMMAAFVFAAQMVNFPVLPGVSGHLSGGVLAAVVLGPWAGAVVVGAVLLVQAVLFADGGYSALGANFLNMGLLGAVVGYAIFAEVRRLAGGGAPGTLFGAMVAAWVAVLLSAAACATEIAASGLVRDPLPLLGWMALVHALIGLGEALITGLVLQTILAVRPDLIPGATPEAEADAPASAGPARGRLAVAGLGVALAVAVFLAPFAWPTPDGLEYSVERVGIAAAEPEGGVAAPPAPMAEYHLPLPGVASLRVATAAAGAVGTVVVFAAAAVLARALARRVEAGAGAPAAAGVKAHPDGA